ncbi:MAG TPA: STAS domain-containing protein [Steroidobacteraceae bacterium]|nr:STAS domain-containing protein [Steroidobacteraceae bacterium]
MKNSAGLSAIFEVQENKRSRVKGVLHFSTVTALLRPGSEAIAGGHATVVDLAGVSDSDSAGLALLIEWLSVAKTESRGLRYENIPAQLQQLARLSEVEELLTAS